MTVRAAAGALAGAAALALSACGGSTPSPPPAHACAAVPGIQRTAAASGPGTSAGGPFFAKDSIWNRRVPADAPLDPRSRAVAKSLGEQGAVLSSLASRNYGVPLYTVGPKQPCVHVTVDNPNAGIRAAVSDVPLPPDAQPAVGTDGHLALWQPSTDTYWEFFKLHKEADGWHAKRGGRIVQVSQNPGYFVSRRGANGRLVEDPLWGATATSLPLIGGLVTLDDLRRGRIDHALSIAVPHVLRGVRALPASRSDGKYVGPEAVPEGAHFRLDPKLNLNDLGLSPFTKMIAQAAQRYGMYVRDGGTRVAVYAQVAVPGVADPYPEVLQGKRPFEALQDFPWTHLQLLPMKLKPYAPS